MSMLTKILIYLGYRSRCCEAKTYFPDDGYDHEYCMGCNNRIL